MYNVKKNILVVDDEKKITEVIESFLISKGYGIFTANCGKDALLKLEKENISLILLDLMLPDIKGEEICKIIRKKSRVPIIVLTAKVEENDMLYCLSIGADDYITKPFSLKTLLARTEAVLRRSFDYLKPLYKKMSFNNNDLEIDFDSHVVKKDNKIAALTPNEFKIFSVLAKTPNKVFTRDEIIETAFGNDFDGFSRAIDSHIKNLRQKIETNPKEPVYVLTIHGVGYKFGGEKTIEISPEN